MSYRKAAREADDFADDYRRNTGGAEGSEERRRRNQDAPGAKTGSFSAFLADLDQKLGVSFSGADDPRREWLYQGKFEKVTSSNVYAIAYDLASRALFVQYRFWAPGETRTGPGPIYRYEDVAPKLALDAYDAISKGVWIWDKLRIRGSVAGHQVPYQLFHIVGEYVPRKATFLYGGEWYVPRDFYTKTSNGWKPVRSTLPLAPAYWKGDDASPFTGKPNNGSPK